MSSLPSPDAHILDAVWQTIYERREALKAGADPSSSRTMRLFKKGRKKAAQKYGEEAVECLIEAVRGAQSYSLKRVQICSTTGW